MKRFFVDCPSGYLAAVPSEDPKGNYVRFEDVHALHTAAKCALADLEGIMPKFDPSGDRSHPAWTTIEELKRVLKEV